METVDEQLVRISVLYPGDHSDTSYLYEASRKSCRNLCSFSGNDLVNNSKGPYFNKMLS